MMFLADRLVELRRHVDHLRAMVAAVEQQRTRVTKKWQLRCPAVVESVKEAGDELFAG